MAVTPAAVTLQLVQSDTCSLYDVPLEERLRAAGIDTAPGGRVTPHQSNALADAERGAGPLVRLFCKRSDGGNQVVYLRNAPPYLYVQAPPEFAEEHVPKFMELVEALVHGAHCVSVTLVRDRKRYMGHTTRPTPLLRVALRDPRHIGKLRNEWLGPSRDLPPLEFLGMRFPRRVWEADVPYHLRVCVDLKLAPFGWFGLPDGRGTAVHGDTVPCTHTIIDAAQVHTFGSTGAHSSISPALRLVAFDIECEALVAGTFPTAARDPVISIGAVIYDGVDTAAPRDAVVFISNPPERERPACTCCYCLAGPPLPCDCCQSSGACTHPDDCSQCQTHSENKAESIGSADHCACAVCAADQAWMAASVARHTASLGEQRFRVVVLPDEVTLLKTFATHMREVWGAHFLLGYNSARFDVPYLQERAQTLNCWADVGRLSPWDWRAIATIKKNQINTRAHGRTDDSVVQIPGVCHVDLFPVILKEARCADGTKPRSYKLGDISAEFLSPPAPHADSDGNETPEEEWGLGDAPAAEPSEDVRAQAAEVLGDTVSRIVTKRDLPHQQIGPHYHGTPQQRWTLCDYNEFDARLVGMLNNRLKIVQNLIGMARVTYVDTTALIHGGQQIKVHMQMLALAPELGFVIPTRWREPREDELMPVPAPDAEEPDEEDGSPPLDPRYEMATLPNQTSLAVVSSSSSGITTEPTTKNANGKRPVGDTATQLANGVGATVQLTAKPARIKRLKRKTAAAREKGYDGAVVLEPKRGLYPNPITTLDFSSLYPSIMRQHNLSHDTLITEAQLCQHGHCMLNSKEVLQCCVHETPNGDRFVNASVHKGLLSVLLERLLTERGAAKRAMAEAKKRGDAAEEAVQDGRQLALKISANSVYGFTGATVGKLPCLEISAGVTAYGRDMINEIKALVEEVFPLRVNLIPNQQNDTEVVYGDSVTGDTPVYLLNTSTNKLHICEIEELHSLIGATYGTWLGEKEHATASGWKIWTARGWSDLVRVVRHRTAKPIVRVLTHTGAVDVTADHSLLRPDGSAVKPAAVDVGTILLHRDLPLGNDDGASGAITDAEFAFALGLFFADGSCGAYQCPSGFKRSWAINKQNVPLLERVGKTLDRYYAGRTTFKLLDTLASSGVYKLVPCGDVKSVVDEFRPMFYSPNRTKIVPHQILNACGAVRQAFFEGYYSGDGDKDKHGYVRFDVKGKIGAAGMYQLVTSLGYTASVNDRSDKLDIFRVTCCRGDNDQRKPSDVVKRKREFAPTGDLQLVYDVETADGTFAAGVGRMVVHNTDSIMVNFGIKTVGEACDIGRRAATLINAFFDLRVLTPEDRAAVAAEAAPLFPGETIDAAELLALLKRRPDEMARLISGRRRGAIAIVFEKALRNYLLIAKKRYFGELWLNAAKPDHIHQSGVESVRRDNSLYTNETIAEVVRVLAKRGNVPRAIQYSRKRVRDLARGRIPFEKLVVSRAYNKRIQDYADANKGQKAGSTADATRYTGSQPHLIVVQKREQRHEQPIKMGERVPYVLVMPQGQDAMHGAARKRKLTQADIVEDPEYAQRHHLRPHSQYYVEHQIEKPLTRIFDTILGEGATRRLVLTPDVVGVAAPSVRPEERFFGAFLRGGDGCANSVSKNDGDGAAVDGVRDGARDGVGRNADGAPPAKAARVDGPPAGGSGGQHAPLFNAAMWRAAADELAPEDDGDELPPTKAARGEPADASEAATALFDDMERRRERETAAAPTMSLTEAAASRPAPPSTEAQIAAWRRSTAVKQRTVDSFFGKRQQ